MAGYQWLFFCLCWIKVDGVIRKEHIIQENINERETSMTPEDYKNLEKFQPVDLKTIPGIKVPDDPLISANKFEGDIANITSRTIHKFINDSNNLGRAAVKDKWRLWPKKEIPYSISSTYGTYSRSVILKAFEEYRQKTCLRFVPRTTQTDYIYIKPDDGCYSLVGKVGGVQLVSLDAGCIQVGTVIHELMHSAGFFHEQSRTDRDDNVDIVWENIDPEAKDQFEKYGLRTITLLGLPYDYSSIMHYGPKAFTKNGAATIKALKGGGDQMGQREGFSDLDLQKLNTLYDCNIDSSTAVTRDGSGGLKSKTTPRPTKKCADKKWQCFVFKTFGYCDSDRDRMLDLCPKMCGLCDQVASIEGQIISPNDQQPSNSPSDNQPSDGFPINNGPSITGSGNPACRDNNDHCDLWASDGYCHRDGYTDFVGKSCPKACGKCGGGNLGRDPGTGCQDKNEKCVVYAAMNMCHGGGTNEHMKTNCRRSCQLC